MPPTDVATTTTLPTSPAGLRPLAALADLPQEELLTMKVDAQEVTIYRRGGEVFAVQSVCSHRNIPFSRRGSVDGQTLTCTAHGACFDLRTGEVTDVPFPPEYGTASDLDHYDVVVQDGTVYLRTLAG